MALNGDILGKEMYDALGLESEIDSNEGMDSVAKSKAKAKGLDKQKKVANAIIKHIINNIEIAKIKVKLDSTAVSTNVTTTVAPGIVVATSGGPGATTSPGTGTGTGTGNVNNGAGSQTNDGKGLVK